MSPLYKKALSAVAILMLCTSVSAKVYRLTGYPDKDCNQDGFYDTFSTSEDSNHCIDTYYSSDDFELVNNDYQIYWSLDDEIADNCEVVMLGEPRAGSRDCGVCLGTIKNTGTCLLIPVPAEFYLSWCCGSDCEEYCGSPRKRSLDSNWTEPVKVERTIASPPADPAKMKSQPLLKERAKCSFKANGDLYNSIGAPVEINNEVETCTSEDGCPLMYTASVEQSYSQTFGVSESTEAGFFDVISETVSFEYDQTWEKSKSVSVSGKFNVPHGAGGTLIYSPISQCIKGSFSGDDCPKGVKINEEGEACVPETINNGKQPKGDISLVIQG